MLKMKKKSVGRRNGDAQARHHHARRHRADGAQPASGALDPGHPRAGRRGAAERRPRDARPDPGRPQRRQGRGARAASTASSAGPPISTPRSNNPDDTVFFDAGTTQMRADLLTRAIEAGKHVYCEKPVADTLDEALAVARLAKARGVKNGVVQDKLFLPGLRKIRHAARRRLLRPHLRGARRVRLLGVRRRLGQPAQRPSWNYRKADGGGIILDMLCHWRYVLDNLFGEVKAVSCLGATHIPSASTRTASPTRPTPTTPPTPPSSSRAASSRTSTRPGACACAATISSPSRSTARTARRSPA